MVIARNSNLLGNITVLVMVSFVVNTALALDGSGTEEDPWLIQSLEDFNDFAGDPNYWDDYTRLEIDVNLAGMVYTTTVIAPDTNNSSMGFQGTAFTGVLDGNNHRIIGLVIYDNVSTHDQYLGLFGYIREDGQVSNLGLEGGFVSGRGLGIGGLVSTNKGILSNCYSNTNVSGMQYVGGLVGGNWGILSNCYSTSDVNGFFSIGSLVGINHGSVSDCYSTGDVTGNVIGGLVGWNYHAIISNCYSTCDVNGVERVGGLVGQNYSGNISNCYSNGNVNGVEDVGGLVGRNWDGSISYCYSAGDVSGGIPVGGLVGRSDTGVSNCFWDTDTQTHGVTESIGLNEGDVNNVAGLPTVQMQTRSTFTDWDFINVWNIGENQTYPYLRTFPSGDINKDGIVNFLDVAITANQWMEGVE